jgi:hypothetical protein
LLQMHLAQFGVVVKVGRGAGEGHAAVAQDRDAVGDLEDFADFLLDDEDGRALCVPEHFLAIEERPLSHREQTRALWISVALGSSRRHHSKVNGRSCDRRIFST